MLTQLDRTKGRAISASKHHEIWVEQCEAARTIKARYGLKAAFDYAVGEKLINFASAAYEHPAFARELPRFVSEVRLRQTKYAPISPELNASRPKETPTFTG